MWPVPRTPWEWVVLFAQVVWLSWTQSQETKQ